MASTHEALLLLARMFLVHVIGIYIFDLLSILGNVHQFAPDQQPGRGSGSGHCLKVIACGFSRSGTMSLQLALQHIGFDPCYHGFDAVIYPRHSEFWLKAAIGKLDDWSLIDIGGYKAIADMPAACFYKELMAAYPNAKVILNIRDPEQWYESCWRTLYKSHCNLLIRMFRLNFWRVTDALLFEGKFKGRFDDKEFAIGVYMQHMEEVKRVVPKEKLLVYKVEDGWIPLCHFLEVDTPQDTPFPRINDSSFFDRNVHKTVMVLRLALAVYVALISVMVVAVLKCITSYSH